MSIILVNRFQDVCCSRSRHRDLLEEWDPLIDVKKDISLGRNYCFFGLNQVTEYEIASINVSPSVRDAWMVATEELT